jgi:hypothetical protein
VLLLAKFFGCKLGVAVFIVAAIVVGYEGNPLNFVGFNQQLKAFNEGRFGLRDKSGSASDYEQIAPFHVQTTPQKLQSGSDEPLIATENSQVAAELVLPSRPTAKPLRIHFLLSTLSRFGFFHYATMKLKTAFAVGSNLWDRDLNLALEIG